MRKLGIACWICAALAVGGCRPTGDKSPTSSRLGVAQNPNNQPPIAGKARGGGPPSPAELPTISPPTETEGTHGVAPPRQQLPGDWNAPDASIAGPQGTIAR